MDIDLSALPDDVETLQRLVSSLAAERIALSDAPRDYAWHSTKSQHGPLRPRAMQEIG
jgi:hypothetical protein